MDLFLGGLDRSGLRKFSEEPEKFDRDRKGVELKQSLISGRFVREGYSEPTRNLTFL